MASVAKPRVLYGHCAGGLVQTVDTPDMLSFPLFRMAMQASLGTKQPDHPADVDKKLVKTRHGF